MARRLRIRPSSKATPLVPKLGWDIEQRHIEVSGNVVPGYQAIVRNDNEKVLSVTKKSYHPASNERFMTVVNQLHEFTGFNIVGYSEFNEGRKVFAYLKNDDQMDIGGFSSENFMVVGNTFDKSKGFFTGVSNMVLSCSNQFSQISVHQSIRHNSQINIKLDALVLYYQRFLDQELALKKTFQNWNGISINPELMDLFADKVLDIDTTKKPMSSVKENQRVSLFDSINTEIGRMGNNMYGLFNGLTHYTTHKTNSNKVFGGVIGQASVLNKRGYEVLKEYELSI